MSVLKRLYDLRDGEQAQLFTSGWTLFSIIAAHIMLETARDALFLGAMAPSRLAWVYVAIAGLVMLVLSGNAKLVRGVGRRNALIATLMASGYGTVVFYLLPHTPLVVFLLYLWSALLGTVVVVQYWMLVGELFTVAQGKRLFGPLAAAGAVGALAGSAAATGMLRVLPVDALLLAAAGLFIVTGFILTGAPEESALPPEATGPSRESARKLSTLLRDHPYLRRLSLLLILATMAVLVTDYLFKSVAAQRFAPEELGNFFATYYTVTSGIALVFQVLLSGYIVRKLGLLAAICITPFALLLSGGGVLVLGGGIAMVLITKGVDGALRHSLHRVSLELLWMPLPGDVRSSAKGVIDGVLVRVVQAVTAAGLLGLAAVNLDSPRFLAGTIAALTLLWLAVAMSLRRPYLALFRSALSRFSVDIEGELDLDSVEILGEALSSSEDQRVLAAINVFVEKERTRLIPSLILLHHSEEVVSRALQVIASPDRKDWVNLAQKLLDSSNQAIRIAALRALVRNDQLPTFGKLVDDENPAVRAHAAFWLASHGDADDLALIPEIDAILIGEGDDAKIARVALSDAIASDGDSRWASTLLSLINRDEPGLIELTALATAKVPDDRFIPVLISRLSVRSGRSSIRDAIVALDEPAFAAVKAAYLDSETPARVKLHIPRTLAYFGTQAAADFIVAQFPNAENGLLRYKLLRSLSRMVTLYPVQVDHERLQAGLERNLRQYFHLLGVHGPIEAGLADVRVEAQESGKLLVSLLNDKLRQALQRLILILQIAHPREDIRSLFFAIAVGDKTQRANALEFMDLLTRNPIYDDIPIVAQLLRIVAEDLSTAEKQLRSLAILGGSSQSYAEALSQLLRDDDAVTASIAAVHAMELGYNELAERLMSSAEDRRNSRVLDILGHHAVQWSAMLGTNYAH